LYITNNEEGIANCVVANGSTPMNDGKKLMPKNANASYMSCHVKRKLEIDDYLIEGKKRLDCSDTIESVASRSIANSIVIEKRSKRICATARSKENFDVMSVKRTAKKVQKDLLAYEIFKEILKRAEPKKEIWPIALKLCHYCLSLDCTLGDQCLQRVLFESEKYSDDLFLRRSNVYSLCLMYDKWLSKQNEVKKLKKNKNGIMNERIRFDKSDLKEIAECIFQDLYTRAVDETYDKLNVIYYYHRLCNYCNRFECCDKDQTCNFKPVFDKSKNYRAFKEFERQELEIQMQNYLVRHKVSKEIVDKYRSTKNELKKYPIVDILNAKPKEVESRPVLVGNDIIGNEKSGLIDNSYENTSIHDSNQEMYTGILTSNNAPVSEKETAENFLFCNATYNDNGKEILFSCESNFKNECYHLNANEIKKNSKAFCILSQIRLK
jgi:hypothetical protein